MPSAHLPGHPAAACFRTRRITTRLGATQPLFLVSQVFFVLASGASATVGIVTGRVSGLDALVMIAIPAIALLAAVRIYRRLRAVHAKRPRPSRSGAVDDAIIAGQDVAGRLEGKRYRAVVGIPKVDVGLHLEMKVRHGRVS